LATSRLRRTPAALVLWLTSNERSAALAKDSHLTRDFNLPVQDWFQKTGEWLIRSLHSFFQSRIEAQRRARATGNVLPPPDPRRDYREFLRCFSQAIREFDSPGDAVLSADPVLEFQDFAGHISAAFSDFEPSILVNGASDGATQTLLTTTGKKLRDYADQPELEPLRKKMRMTVTMDMEGGKDIDSFNFIVGEIRWRLYNVNLLREVVQHLKQYGPDKCHQSMNDARISLAYNPRLEIAISG
jgi:hypothetical protein